MNISRVIRSLYLAGFFVVLPLVGAILLVTIVAPNDAYVATTTLGAVRTLFRDQRVPVGIVLFTVLEVALWNQRHQLPWSEVLATPGRKDVPSRFRSEFERAAALLEEADRIIEKHAKKLDRDLRATEREELKEALDDLRAAMQKAPFDADAFEHALIRADGEVDVRLGRWRKGEVREYAESIGIAVAVALLLRFFFVEAFKIPSGSMIPTLQIGDHIFVNKTAYGPLLPFSRTRLFPSLPPKRGDVMVFEFPENRDQDFIKRVIAIPGDKLEVRDGHPILNGWRVPFCQAGQYEYTEGESPMRRKADLDVEYLEDKAYLTLYERTFLAGGTEMQGPYYAKQGEVWVLGDNRNNSHDSRGWFEGRGGGVPFANIKGRAMFVWLSFEPSGKIAWERFLVDVLGKPKLPLDQQERLGPAVEKCLRERPPFSETTPPPPSK